MSEATEVAAGLFVALVILGLILTVIGIAAAFALGVGWHVAGWLLAKFAFERLIITLIVGYVLMALPLAIIGAVIPDA